MIFTVFPEADQKKVLFSEEIFSFVIQVISMVPLSHKPFLTVPGKSRGLALMDRETTQFLRMELAKLERAEKKDVCWGIFADLKRTSSCSRVHPSRVLMGLTPLFESSFYIQTGKEWEQRKTHKNRHVTWLIVYGRTCLTTAQKSKNLHHTKGDFWLFRD